ncbi:Lrp/AsnC family transcriptional regulator [Oceanidesulfovibrio marinus]|nr:Lrp/AsnC family transcriptional regulator [Oceanidesulfovibrio marinus]
MREFSEKERAILREVQGVLPDDPAPFARIAEKVGATEDEVLQLLQECVESGVIRRFGASLKHQKAGFGANVMVAWRVEDDAVRDAAGTHMAKSRHVSHAYYRKPPASGEAAERWPYSLYTMVHGKSREECLATVEELSRDTGIEDYALLFSQKELKKSSMTYF